MKNHLIPIVFNIFLLVSYTLQGNGQSQTDESSSNQVLAPPSPTVSGLGRYGEYPINLATGTPEISIPIYEIKSRKLNLPISLSYHATGIKVDQYASWVGLGWSLNAGGIISRAMLGLPDEESGGSYSGYFLWEDLIRESYNTNFNPEEDEDFLEHAALGNYDTEPDIFFYNIPTGTGKFIFYNDTARTIPYKPVKIMADLEADNKKFKIISENGTIYNFGTSIENEEAFETTKKLFQNFNPPYKEPIYCVTGWYLTEIISADYSDTIYFKYETHNINYSSTLIQSLDYFYDFDATGPYTLSHSDGEINLNWEEDAMALYLESARKIKEIIFPNGKILFHSNNDREDLSGGKSLSSIEIYNKKNLNTPVKKINFHYSYYNANTFGDWEENLDASKKKRLKLDSLTIQGQPPYRFEYSSIALPPINSFRQDHWGYFNDEKYNENLIQKTTFNGINLGGANRSPKKSVMNAGMLETIYYPTGGYTQFEFEANECNNNTTGGIRIKQIKNYDGTAINNVNIKHYKYTGGRLINHNINYGYTKLYNEGIMTNPNGSSVSCVTNSYKSYHLLPQSFVELGTSGGSPVVYKYVTVKDTVNGKSNGKSIYHYTTNEDHTYFGDNVDQYKFSNPDNFLYYTLNNDWKRGKLIDVIHYDKFGKKKKKIINLYLSADSYTSTDIIGLKVDYRTNYIGCRPIEVNKYNYIHTHTYNKWLYLANTTTIDFDQNDDSKYAIVKIEYEYQNNKHTQVTKTTKMNSKGDTTTTKYKYPPDVSFDAIEEPSMDCVAHCNDLASQYYPCMANCDNTCTGEPPSCVDSCIYEHCSDIIEQCGNCIEYRNFYHSLCESHCEEEFKREYEEYLNQFSPQAKAIKKMVDKNMIAQPIQVIKNINGDAVEGSYTTYKELYSGAIVPDIVHMIETTTPLASVAETHVNSSGTLVKDENFNEKVFYDAYNDFGNISQVHKKGDIPTSYLWGYNNTLLVAKVVGVSYNEVIAKVSPQEIQGLTGEGLSTRLATLRELDAMVTIYTYDPLIGMTSMTDENGITTYYEYDEFGRLKCTRDDEKNIINTYKYHYAGEKQ